MPNVWVYFTRVSCSENHLLLLGKVKVDQTKSHRGKVFRGSHIKDTKRRKIGHLQPEPICLSVKLEAKGHCFPLFSVNTKDKNLCRYIIL